MNDREIWDRTALASLNMIAAYVNASKSIAAEPHLQFLKRLTKTQLDSRILGRALEASEGLGALHERSGNLEAARAEQRWRQHILDNPPMWKSTEAVPIVSATS
jgi:hypothetical protein